MLIWSVYFSACFALLSNSKTPLIVGIGDSWVHFDTYFSRGLGDFCVGKDMKNSGVNGATAAEWASGQYSVANAIQNINTQLHEVTDVWLSVGGNDWLQSYGLAVGTIAGNIETIGDQIRNVAPNANIFMLGYSINGMPNEFALLAHLTPDLLNGLFNSLNDAVQQGARRIGATYVETMDSLFRDQGLFAGLFGDPIYFTDVIHLNEAGYCNMWSQDVIQNILQCQPASYTCASPKPKDSMKCAGYEGNNLMNDCVGGSICTLSSESRAPFCAVEANSTVSPSNPPEITDGTGLETTFNAPDSTNDVDTSVESTNGINTSLESTNRIDTSVESTNGIGTTVEATNIGTTNGESESPAGFTDIPTSRPSAAPIITFVQARSTETSGDKSGYDIYWTVATILMALCCVQMAAFGSCLYWKNKKQGKEKHDFNDFEVGPRPPPLPPRKYISQESQGVNEEMGYMTSMSTYELEEGSLPSSLYLAGTQRRASQL